MREKLIELLDGWDCPILLAVCEAEALADYLIENGVTVQRWIPVTERLPEYDVKVLVCNSENGDLHTATLDNEIWHLDGGWLLDVDDFTHWMPKPILPKDGDT